MGKIKRLYSFNRTQNLWTQNITQANPSPRQKKNQMKRKGQRMPKPRNENDKKPNEGNWFPRHHTIQYSKAE
jgi:hypothetical protein